MKYNVHNTRERKKKTDYTINTKIEYTKNISVDGLSVGWEGWCLGVACI